MKTIKRFGFAAFAALTLGLSSCGSDDGPGGNGSSAANYVNAKVDGSSFETLVISGQSLGSSFRTGTGAGTLINVTGSSAESLTSQNIKTITISLMGITAVGTYEINSESNSSLAYVDSAAQLSYDTSDCSGATGTITITTLSDTKIEGTFSFTGKDDENCASQKVVTQGQFRGTFLN